MFWKSITTRVLDNPPLIAFHSPKHSYHSPHRMLVRQRSSVHRPDHQRPEGRMRCYSAYGEIFGPKTQIQRRAQDMRFELPMHRKERMANLIIENLRI